MYQYILILIYALDILLYKHRSAFKNVWILWYQPKHSISYKTAYVTSEDSDQNAQLSI